MALLSLTACHTDPDGVACDTSAAAGLMILVQDAAGNAPICDAKVTIQSATEQPTTLTSMGPECSYVGAYERAGAWTITTERAGYKTDSRVVTVPAGTCHVVGQHVTVALVKL